MAAQSHDSSHPSCFLLRLPSSLRRLIYLHLGVARWNGLPILFDLDGPVKRTRQVSFRGLLLSCRLIHSEASNLLFSSNRFVIHYGHARGDGDNAEPSLQPLRNLTVTSLASLTNLKVVLSQASCHHRSETEAWGECCDDIRHNLNGTRLPDYCREHHTTHHDKLLRSSHSAAEPMLDEWLRTADYLSSRISAGILRLSLVCDLDQEEAGMDTATRVVAPLSLLPELKDCDVRLCKDPNVELTRIARNAALQACRRPELPPSSSGLHLLSLPRELRLQILEYTDLITPWKEVMWTRRSRGYQYPADGCYARGRPCRPSYSWHHGCQFQGCHHQRLILIETDCECVAYSDSIGCFCRLRHAAFSSNRACRCWAPSTPLFLICRYLSDDAKFVFFSRNRFIVSDSVGYRPDHTPPICSTYQRPEPQDGWTLAYLDMLDNAPPPRAYPAYEFAASRFLKEVVPADCLSYLRFLELVFPPYNHQCWPHDGHPALRDWIATVNWVKDKINAPGLTLRLTMAGTLSRAPPRPDDRTELSQSQGDAVLAGYDRILKPLACLGAGGGLSQFYADFVWPWKWTREADENRRVLGDGPVEKWMKAKEAMLNERAERFVLVNRYDQLSAGAGRFEMRPWKHAYRIHH